MRSYLFPDLRSQEVITTLGVEPGMALRTQSLEIVPVVSTPIRQLHLVMGNDGRSEPGFTLAYFTQRAGLDKGGAYPLPGLAVVFVTLPVTAETIITGGFSLGMFRAVPAAYQLRAAVVGARLPWLEWHCHTSI